MTDTVVPQWHPHRRQFAAVALLVGLVGLLAEMMSDLKSAHADSCNLTLCTASHWGYNMTAIFIVDGFPVAANWNFTSETTFYAYPQNPTTLVNSHAHRVWTSAWWPNGTWLVAQSTYTLDGAGGPLKTYLGMGPDYSSGDFDRWTSVWGLNTWTLLTAIERATAGLYPAGGAGGAFNHTRDECKKLTPTGAVGC